MLKNKKIAAVFTAAILGGHEIMAVTHIKRYLSKGFGIEIFLPKNNHALIEMLTEDNLPFETHNVLHKRMEILHAFFNAKHISETKSLLSFLSTNFDEIIIIQGDIELGSSFIRVSRMEKCSVTSYIPYTHSFKRMGSKLSGIKDYLSKKLYKKCDSFITISGVFQRDLQNKNPKAKVKVIKNNIPKPPESEIRGLGYNFISNEKKIKILMAGRVYFRQKGQDELIKAILNIQTEKELEVVIVGSGPDLLALKEAGVSLPKNIYLNFLGWKKNVWDFSKDVDLIVIPSKYEGVPLVMLEAIKRGIPVIAPARDGMIDYLPRANLYSIDDNKEESDSLKDKLLEFLSTR